jgi:hypothetical protein
MLGLTRYFKCASITRYDALSLASQGEAMRRRSRASGTPAKAQPQKAVTQKRDDVSKAKRRGSSAAAGQETEIARLRRELSEALEQQAVTTEVLRTISSSSGNLKAVFESMLARAMRICDAQFGALCLYDGDCYQDDLERVRLICGTECRPYKMLKDVIDGTATY